MINDGDNYQVNKRPWSKVATLISKDRHCEEKQVLRD